MDSDTRETHGPSVNGALSLGFANFTVVSINEYARAFGCDDAFKEMGIGSIE